MRILLNTALFGVLAFASPAFAASSGAGAYADEWSRGVARAAANGYCRNLLDQQVVEKNSPEYFKRFNSCVDDRLAGKPQPIILFAARPASSPVAPKEADKK